ncbi:MAG: ATP-binding protein [Bacteroidota bacterium]|nr:ATP-binding protein [Bacteroidota bacterium]
MTETYTFFASPERRSDDELAAQRARLMKLPHLLSLLEAFPTPAVILNDARQIVLSNASFEATMPRGDFDRMLGLRVGEALGCHNLRDAPSGCGTGKACRMCGAVLAMLEAQQGRRSVQECRITVDGETGRQALDFRVLGVPLQVNGDAVTILSLVDVSDEKRRRVFERIFFHDLLNSAGGLQTLTDLLRIVPTEEQDPLLEDLQGISGQLINEIETQRDLLAAEGNDLKLSLRSTTTDDMIAHIHSLYRYHRLTRERHIKCINQAAGASFTSDPTLLSRAIGNLLKNALEAVEPGATVTVSCQRDGDDGLAFHVHNPGVLPEDVRLQLFQRSFSTKGPGRGIGTYSARLLVERFLGGTVMFTSSAETGTRFSVRIPHRIEGTEESTYEQKDGVS